MYVIKKTGFTIYRLLITIASFFGVVLFKSNINWTDLSKNCVDMTLVKEIAYDISISIFTAMVIIWFIDAVSDYIEERIANKRERQAISRIHSVLSQYISKYRSHFYLIVTPLAERKENGSIPDNFIMRNMRDLYSSTFNAGDGIEETAVSLFLQAELELRMQISSLLLSYELNNNTKLKDIFVKFLNESINFNCRSAINDAPQRQLDNKQLSKHISELLDNGEGDKYRKKVTEDKSLCSNILFPYVMLHDLMKKEIEIINEYEEIIRCLLSDNAEKRKRH